MSKKRTNPLRNICPLCSSLTTMRSGCSLPLTANNWISILSRLYVTFRFLGVQIAILCMFELNIFILVTIYTYLCFVTPLFNNGKQQW